MRLSGPYLTGKAMEKKRTSEKWEQPGEMTPGEQKSEGTEEKKQPGQGKKRGRSTKQEMKSQEDSNQIKIKVAEGGGARGNTKGRTPLGGL